jgi:hypothetical protein
MKAQQEIRTEQETRLRSEALNRIMQQHEEEVDILADHVDHYRNICAGLVLALVLSLSGAGYCLYYLSKPCEPVQVAKVIKAEKVKKGGEQYVLTP